MLLLLGCAGCSRTERLKETPPDLLGVWTSPDQRYADRYLDFRRNTVVFGTGAGAYTEHTIVEYERARTETSVDYRITFVTDNQRETLPFKYFPDKTLQFENQWVVWTKKDTK